MDLQYQHNLTVEGKWNVDLPEWEHFELWRTGDDNLTGKAVISGFAVALNEMRVYI